jgi:superoxide reductase
VLSVNTVHQTIDEYNRYHAPEATVQLSNYDKHYYCVQFTGSFCYTCGFYDYFDDFKYLLEDHGIITVIDQVTETVSGAYVSFQLKRSDGKRGTS